MCLMSAQRLTISTGEYSNFISSCFIILPQNLRMVCHNIQVKVQIEPFKNFYWTVYNFCSWSIVKSLKNHSVFTYASSFAFSLIETGAAMYIFSTVFAPQEFVSKPNVTESCLKMEVSKPLTAVFFHARWASILGLLYCFHGFCMTKVLWHSLGTILNWAFVVPLFFFTKWYYTFPRPSNENRWRSEVWIYIITVVKWGTEVCLFLRYSLPFGYIRAASGSICQVFLPKYSSHLLC
jgi:hypothetical protein